MGVEGYVIFVVEPVVCIRYSIQARGTYHASIIIVLIVAFGVRCSTAPLY